MTSLTRSGPYYRTKCLPLEKAARFARCIRGNARFTDISIETSRLAKGEAKHFVSFRPSNPARLADIINRQQDRREEKAASEGTGYLWSQDESGRWAWCCSLSGEVYEVSEHNCSCPDWQYRCQHAGIACKHVLALRSAVERGELFGDQQAQDEADPGLVQGPAGAVWMDGEPPPCPHCGDPQPGERCPCEYRDYFPGEELDLPALREEAEALDAALIARLRSEGEDAERQVRAEWGAAECA